MKISRLIVALLAVMLVLCSSAGAFALEDGFETEEYPPEKLEELLENIDLQPIEGVPELRSFDCYDVGEDDTFAVGFSDMGKAGVYVYAPDGTFSWGFTMSGGTSIYLELDGENVLLYRVRSDLALTVDSNSNCLEVRKIPHSKENKIYWRQLGDRERTAGQSTYAIGNKAGPLNLLALSYGQITRTDADGTATVIYDAGVGHIVMSTLLFLGGGIFAAFVIVKTVKNLREFFAQRKQERERKGT